LQLVPMERHLRRLHTSRSFRVRRVRIRTLMQVIKASRLGCAEVTGLGPA
jgi:hypothetical protein